MELGNSAFYEGQCHGYRRWQLACIAASRVLDWRDFITLPMPDAGDPSATAQFKRRLFDLFPHQIYEWHSVARFFCNHLCADAFEDWMRACVEQQQDLGPGQFPAPTCAGRAARAGEIGAHRSNLCCSTRQSQAATRARRRDAGTRCPSLRRFATRRCAFREEVALKPPKACIVASVRHDDRAGVGGVGLANPEPRRPSRDECRSPQ